MEGLGFELRASPARRLGLEVAGQPRADGVGERYFSIS